MHILCGVCWSVKYSKRVKQCSITLSTPNNIRILFQAALIWIEGVKMLVSNSNLIGQNSKKQDPILDR